MNQEAVLVTEEAVIAETESEPQLCAMLRYDNQGKPAKCGGEVVNGVCAKCKTYRSVN